MDHTAQHLAAMTRRSTDPATLSVAARPDFVPFAPGRLVGWVVNAATGCWEWNGRLNHGQALVSVGGRPVNVVRELAMRASNYEWAGCRPVRTCNTPNCVNPEHRVWCAPGETLLDHAAELRPRLLPTQRVEGGVWQLLVPVDDLRAVLESADPMDMYPETTAAYERLRALLPTPKRTA